ncbi:ImuA family protein [Mucilaginibacter auburnensis]|uniref:Protein ImuA n=1 Tax=Mucilaginibacter auburnensis TaxID=1457233 RepID=A0A2H9VMC5_9SPHI|nr:Error-prone repair protein ImuA [Mucilaginibacter auburnensis]PJJ79490.1 protein ImuA [Mucilaginibacter auburnensis]
MPLLKNAVISRLQKDILQWEGYRPPEAGKHTPMGLGVIEQSFPNNIFPTGTVHEVLCANTEQATAGSAFISALLAKLMQQGGVCLWIGLSGNINPSALKAFGVDADRIIFINVLNDQDVLWATEEALKCPGLVMTIAEVRDLNFKQSRRLQLAVEQSRVTGFILRNQAEKLTPTACAARWQISPLPSTPEDGLPGLGFPRWRVELLKVRNGQPGCWEMEWANGKFNVVEQTRVEQKPAEYRQLMAG